MRPRALSEVRFAERAGDDNERCSRCCESAFWPQQGKRDDGGFSSDSVRLCALYWGLHLRHWNALAQCGVEIRNLQALKDPGGQESAHGRSAALCNFPGFLKELLSVQDTLSDRNSIDLPLPDIRSQIIQLAEQHIASEKLQQLYRVLSSGYTLWLDHT